MLKALLFLALLSVPSPVVDVASQGETLRLFVDLPAELHVQANPSSEEYLMPTTLKPLTGAPERIVYPNGVDWEVSFNDTPISVYKDSFVIDVIFGGDSVPRTFEALLVYQACDDDQCYFPTALQILARKSNDEWVVHAVEVPFTEELGGIAEVEEPAGSGLSTELTFIGLASLFLLGVALNLTPCVYPMIPITLGFFGAQASASEESGPQPHTRSALVLVYAVALAASFTLLGVIAAITGSVFGNLMTSPVVLIFISTTLVILALWSFGFFEVRFPIAKAFQSRKGFTGAALMGATAGLIAAPCVGPVIAGVFLIVAESRDLTFGLLSFGAIGAGIATPLAILGLAAGWISHIPKPGVWMLWTKKVFGVLLLLGAVYPLMPIIGVVAASRLAAGILVIGGLLLTVPGFKSAGGLFRMLRLFLLVIAVASAVVLWDTAPDRAIRFEPYLPTSQSGPPAAVVDVYADWCLPCVVMDRTTFREANVHRAAHGLKLLRIDITESPSSSVEQWLRTHEVTGVPTMLFFDQNGEEIRELRVVGMASAPRIVDHFETFRARLDETPALWAE